MDHHTIARSEHQGWAQASDGKAVRSNDEAAADHEGMNMPNEWLVPLFPTNPECKDVGYEVREGMTSVFCGCQEYAHVEALLSRAKCLKANKDPRSAREYHECSDNCWVWYIMMIVTLGISNGIRVGRHTTDIRSLYGIAGSKSRDLATGVFCGPCSQVRNAMELRQRMHNEHGVDWFGPGGNLIAVMRPYTSEPPMVYQTARAQPVFTKASVTDSQSAPIADTAPDQLNESERQGQDRGGRVGHLSPVAEQGSESSASLRALAVADERRMLVHDQAHELDEDTVVFAPMVLAARDNQASLERSSTDTVLVKQEKSRGQDLSREALDANTPLAAEQSVHDDVRTHHPVSRVRQHSISADQGIREWNASKVQDHALQDRFPYVAIHNLHADGSLASFPFLAKVHDINSKLKITSSNPRGVAHDLEIDESITMPGANSTKTEIEGFKARESHPKTSAAVASWGHSLHPETVTSDRDKASGPHSLHNDIVVKELAQSKGHDLHFDKTISSSPIMSPRSHKIEPDAKIQTPLPSRGPHNIQADERVPSFVNAQAHSQHSDERVSSFVTAHPYGLRLDKTFRIGGVRTTDHILHADEAVSSAVRTVKDYDVAKDTKVRCSPGVVTKHDVHADKTVDNPGGSQREHTPDSDAHLRATQSLERLLGDGGIRRKY